MLPLFRKERDLVQPVAAILDSFIFYRYSLILALSCAAGICFFMACCSYAAIPSRRAATTALMALLLSLPLSRLVYWYGRPDRFSSLTHALTVPSTEVFALAGAFAGCLLAVMISGGQGNRKKMLDCLCVAGSYSLAIGRLACFFTGSDRGRIMSRFTGLPWAYPVGNTAGYLEYRFATFLFQAVVAAVLAILLTVIFLRKKSGPGDVALLFFLLYSATQILLDSTRYDSLYLRSNGFVSIVQVLSAATLLIVMVLLSIRASKTMGWKKRMIPVWILLILLFGGAGFMEYFVQRRGQEALFAYSAMGIYLACVVAFGLLLWQYSPAQKNHE